MENRPVESGDHLQTGQERQVAESSATVVRKVIRDFFLEKNVVPLGSRIHERIFSLKVEHVLQLIFFGGIDIPTDDNQIWVWPRCTGC